MHPLGRPAPLLLAAVLGLGTLVGCDGSGGLVDPGPDPRDAATRFAEGLEAGDLTAVPFAGEAARDVQRSYDAVVADLVGGPVEDLAAEVGVQDVAVGEPTQDGRETASATLGWEWPLAPERGDEGVWSYASRAGLVLVEDEWQVRWQRSVVEPSLGRRSTLDLATLSARRGTIDGAGGVPLVAERRITRVGLDKTQVAPRRAAASARALAAASGIDAAPFVRAVEAAGDQAFVEAIVYRVEELPEALVSAGESIPGARLIAGQAPLAPTKDFGAGLLGRVGPVTAEMVEADPDRYAAGDVAGLSGLQARYESDLAGVDGLVVTAVGPDGGRRRVVRVRPEAGTPLRLTLDESLQVAAESTLADLAPDGALVAVRPSDGAVLAAADGPGTGGINVATFGQVAPGSTFKIVTSLALLRAGLTPASTVTCEPAAVVDGKRFENYDGYPASGLGRVPLRTAVAQSCNTAFIAERSRLDATGLVDAAASLGFGVDHEVGFPAYFGQVEPAADASETRVAADLIGQGTVLASPMAMAGVIASVQAGETVLPHLVEGALAPSPATQDAATLTAREAEDLREMLRAVVTEGSGALLADAPGDAVIAKTGTAEFEEEGELRTHAWMVAAQGDLAVAVYVREGDSGSGVAGPVVERFLAAAGPR